MKLYNDKTTQEYLSTNHGKDDYHQEDRNEIA